MTSAEPAMIEAWRRDPGVIHEVEVPDGRVYEWEGGDLVVMTIELVETLNRRGWWYRLPWAFERVGVVPGEASIMYRRLGVRVV
jgi:hypothetical protein